MKRLRHRGGCLVAPEQLTATTDYAGHTVTIEVSLSDPGAPTLASATCDPPAPPGLIPWERLVYRACAQAASFVGFNRRLPAGGWEGGPVEAGRRKAIRSMYRPRGKLTVAEMMEVATVCERARRKGENEAQEVIDEFGKSKTTAYRYIDAALEAGVLSPRAAT